MANISTGSDRLGRFGHCQDPANDFCVEVEELEGLAYNVCVGLAEPDLGELGRRISSAMEFRVGGDEIAMQAKLRLRQIKGRVETDSRASKDEDAHEKLALYGEACRAYALAPNLASLAAMTEAFDAALAEIKRP